MQLYNSYYIIKYIFKSKQRKFLNQIGISLLKFLYSSAGSMSESKSAGNQTVHVLKSIVIGKESRVTVS